MKASTIAKVNLIIEMTSPVLSQCKNGVCGSCPNNTGKLLWIPTIGDNSSITLSFQYNFFNKSQETTGDIKFNQVGTNVTIAGQAVSYSNPPDRNYAMTTAVSEFPTLAVSLMKGVDKLDMTFNSPCWVYFKQLNPAIGVHDALCFEYNHEKRLITFRSF